MKIINLLLACILFASCQTTPQNNANGTPEVATAMQKQANQAVQPVHTPRKIKSYPLTKCLVSDEPLDEWDDIQTITYQGREMKFCCKMCLKKFRGNPDKYIAMLPKR